MISTSCSDHPGRRLVVLVLQLRRGSPKDCRGVAQVVDELFFRISHVVTPIPTRSVPPIRVLGPKISGRPTYWNPSMTRAGHFGPCRAPLRAACGVTRRIVRALPRGCRTVRGIGLQGGVEVGAQRRRGVDRRSSAAPATRRGRPGAAGSGSARARSPTRGRAAAAPRAPPSRRRDDRAVARGASRWLQHLAHQPRGQVGPQRPRGVGVADADREVGQPGDHRAAPDELVASSCTGLAVDAGLDPAEEPQRAGRSR